MRKKAAVFLLIPFFIGVCSVSAWSWCWKRNTGSHNCAGDYWQQDCCSGQLHAWPGGQMEYRISRSTNDSLLQSIRDGMGKWNDVQMADFTFVEGARTDAYEVKTDNINVVNIDKSWCMHFPESCGQGILGGASCFVYQSGVPLECDIVLNGQEYRWGKTTSGNIVDTVAIIAHEAGHAAGLTHPGGT